MLTMTTLVPGAVEVQLSRGGDAVLAGQFDVHEDDVRVGRLHALDGEVAIAGLADDLEVGLHLEAHPKAAPHVGLVIYQEESNCIHHDVSIEPQRTDRIARRTSPQPYQCGIPLLPHKGEAGVPAIADNADTPPGHW